VICSYIKRLFLLIILNWQLWSMAGPITVTHNVIMDHYACLSTTLFQVQCWLIEQEKIRYLKTPEIVFSIFFSPTLVLRVSTYLSVMPLNIPRWDTHMGWTVFLMFTLLPFCILRWFSLLQMIWNTQNQAVTLLVFRQ